MNFSLPADLQGGHAHCALSWMSMTGPHDPMAASGRGGKSRGALRYFCLFALFCYTQELEQLGRALIGPWTKYKEPLSNLVYVIFTKLAGESVTPAILRFQ